MIHISLRTVSRLMARLSKEPADVSTRTSEPQTGRLLLASFSLADKWAPCKSVPWRDRVSESVHRLTVTTPLPVPGRHVLNVSVSYQSQ